MANPALKNNLNYNKLFCADFNQFQPITDADSDSEEDEEGGGDSKEATQKQQQSIDWGDQDLPKVRPNDNLPSFWFRTREVWLELVGLKLDDDEGMRADKVAGLAEMEARKYYQEQQEKKSGVEEMET